MKVKLMSAIFAIISLIAVAAMIAVPELNWRTKIIYMNATGEIDDLEWNELFSMLRPGSGFYLEPLAEIANPYGVIENPFKSEADISSGRDLYRQYCAACHAMDGSGDTAPALNSGALKHGNSDWWLYRAMREGIDSTQMAAQELESDEAWKVVGFIRHLENEKLTQTGSQSEQTTNYNAPSVTTNRLNEARAENRNWITYSGSYDGNRYSTLDQINVENAHTIELKWMLQTDVQDGYFETSPIINEEIMYVTTTPGSVIALETSSGERIWTVERPVANDVPLCCGQVNRGVALADKNVYWGTLDAHLIALDGKTGDKIWDVSVADYRDGYSITAAPLIVKDKVLIGVGGGEYGIRGFLDAYQIDTGERLWRFYTIPAEGEPGNDSWAGDSWKTGGAPTWLTGSYDPTTNLLYWGTGNPGPLYQGDNRSGDNLYSDSVVALDADTGTLKWYFQFTPHDEHDWDANQIPVLVDREWNGQARSLMLWANRNAFFYVLDRSSGQFLAATAFAEQNWAERIDKNGRPVIVQAARPTPQGAISFPSPQGASNWQSPTYSPQTGLFYVQAIDGGRIVFKQKDEIEHSPGEPFHGSMHQTISRDRPFQTVVRAIDISNGTIKWEYQNTPRNIFWKTGGLISTAGDIVFGGDMQKVFLLNAHTGEELWRLGIGGYVNAAAVTYATDGHQRITIAAGRSLLTFGLAQ